MISRWLSTLLNSAFPPRPKPRSRPRLLLEGLEGRELLTAVYVDAPVWWPLSSASGLFETRTIILNDPSDDLPDSVRVAFASAGSISVLDGVAWSAIWVGGDVVGTPPSVTRPNTAEVPHGYPASVVADSPSSPAVSPPNVPPPAPAPTTTGSVELHVRVATAYHWDNDRLAARDAQTDVPTEKPGPAPAPAVSPAPSKDKASPAAAPRPSATTPVPAPRAVPVAPPANPPAESSPPPAAPPPAAQTNFAPADLPTLPPVALPLPNSVTPVALVPQASARVPERTPIASMSDGALARQFAVERDQAAFTELVRRYGPAVQATAVRVLGDADRARDAAQATFVALARRAHALDDRGSLAGWLHKVARRMALRLRATAARHRRLERAAAELHEDGDDPLLAFDVEDTLRVLREELDRLPEKYRVPLALCYLDGRTHAEVAQEVGLPRGSVAKRIGEGLARLRDGLSSRGLVS